MNRKTATAVVFVAAMCWARQTPPPEPKSQRLDPSYSLQIQTPHVPWARKLDGGKIKVYFFASQGAGRSVCEIAQRLDLDFRTLTFDPDWSVLSYSTADRRLKGDWPGTDDFDPERYSLFYDYLTSDLKSNETYDVIVFPVMRGWGEVPEKARSSLLDRVKRGAGLILVHPYPGEYKGVSQAKLNAMEVWSFSPIVDCLSDVIDVKGYLHPNPQTFGLGRWKRSRDHYIHRNVPIEIFPYEYMHHFRYQPAPGAEVLISGESGEPIVATGSYGRGRVVGLAYYNYGLLPFVDRSIYGKIDDSYWEYVWSLLCRTIVWAAGREPVTSLGQLSVSPPELSSSSTLRVEAEVRNAGPERTLLAELELRNPKGESERKSQLQLHVAGSAANLVFELRGLLLEGGTHFADVILKDASTGATVDWGSTVVKVNSPVRLTKLAVDAETVTRGEPITGHVVLSSTIAGARLFVALIDDYDRLADQVEQAAQGGTFRLETRRVLSRAVWVEATVRDEHRVLDRRRILTLVTPPRSNWNDYEVEMRKSPYVQFHMPWRQTMYEQLKTMGVTIMDDPNTTFKVVQRNPRKWQRFDPEGLYTYLESAYGPIRERYGEKKRLYALTGSKNFLVREPCLSDPDLISRLKQECRRVARKYKPLGPLWYDICNEASITYYADAFEFCFCGHCMSRFRKSLKNQYGSLEALNGQWRTEFKSWEDVVPYTLEEARAKNSYASWSDHRSFMADIFTQTVAQCQDAIHEVDPDVPVGITNSSRTSAFSGYDYYLLANRSGMIRKGAGGWFYDRSFRKDYRWFGASGYGRSGPAAAFEVWNGFIHEGDQGTSNSWHWWNFNPDLTYTATARTMRDVYLELTRGLGKALVNSRRSKAPVAIHYSPASYYAAYAVDGKVPDKIGYNASVSSKTLARLEAADDGWRACLDDLGVPFDYVAPQQLQKGILSERNYSALILPMSIAISKVEKTAIEAFVRGGGIVIADSQVGLTDEHCQPQEKGVLDDLFGIEQVTLLNTSPQATTRATNAQAVELTPEAGSKRTVYFNSVGNGQSIYLDLLNPGLKNRTSFRRVVEQVISKTGVTIPIRLRRSNGEVLEGAYCRLYERGPIRYLGAALPPTGEPAEITIDLGGRLYVYDVRQRLALGQLSVITDTLGPADAKIYALLPYRVGDLGVASKSRVYKQGEEVIFQVEAKAVGGKIGDHVFRIDIMGPDGRPVEAYGVNALSAGGRYQGKILTALNDQRGQWNIRVRDITSGMTSAATFEIR